MSYTLLFTDPITSAADLRTKGNDELNRLRESGAGDETVEAARVAVAAAADLIGTRYFGPGPLVVTINGHANEQHNPVNGYANDSVTITVTDARTPADLTNTSVTVEPEPASGPGGLGDELNTPPIADGDVEKVTAPGLQAEDTLNTPYVEPDDAAAFDALHDEGTTVVMDDSDDPNKDGANAQDKDEAAREAAEDGNTSATIVDPDATPPGSDVPADTPRGDAKVAADGHDVTVEGAGEQLASVTEEQAAEAVEDEPKASKKG